MYISDDVSELRLPEPDLPAVGSHSASLEIGPGSCVKCALQGARGPQMHKKHKRIMYICIYNNAYMFIIYHYIYTILLYVKYMCIYYYIYDVYMYIHTPNLRPFSIIEIAMRFHDLKGSYGSTGLGCQAKD